MKNEQINEWVKVTSKILPPQNTSVLICHKIGIDKQNYDVACYLGKTPAGLHEWLCTDVNIDSKNIIAWKSVERFEEEWENHLVHLLKTALEALEKPVDYDELIKEIDIWISAYTEESEHPLGMVDLLGRCKEAQAEARRRCDENEKLKAANELMKYDVCFMGSTGECCIILSDVFGYAEAEPITGDEIEVLNIYKKYGVEGLIEWCALRT